MTGRRARSLLGCFVFLFVAPGVVARVVPWLMTGWEDRDPPTVLRVVGALLLAAGAVVLLQAFLRFALQGLGTPAPVAPTRHP
ncbi:MAG TPA: hypothetical protein VE757_01825 [Gaiellaceae bacterium]|nr:hypothetical protein [Gaiellaceae bacterium]